MKQLTVSAAMAVLVALFAACSTIDRLRDWIEARPAETNAPPVVVEPPADPTPAPADPEPEKPLGQGSNLFVWKPRADHGGKLCIMLPAWIYSPGGGAPGVLTVNGDAGTFTSYSNGNRSTWRFRRTGAEYGANAEMKFARPGHDPYVLVIPDGSVRVEIVVPPM